MVWKTDGEEQIMSTASCRLIGGLYSSENQKERKLGEGFVGKVIVAHPR
jgi:hypothetical protein